MTPLAPTGGRSWPPLVAAMLGLVLVLLVLPNPLRVPQNNPTAAAEYAPVPGREDQQTTQNFSETNLATSGGIGSGGQGEGFLEGTPPLPPLTQFKPRQKHCVGNPPRQTEDPLSPPCVPFWDDNNGGATWHGVTKDQILISYYNDDSVRGDMNRPYQPSDERGDQTDYYQYNLTRTVKAQLGYFQERFQTYGRAVRMFARSSGGGRGTRPNQRQAEALEIKLEVDPFAVAALIENAQEFAQTMAEYKIPTFGWNEDIPREVYDRVAPYLWSVMPDQETEVTWSASFICRKLKDNNAEFTIDPLMKLEKRKFALLWPASSQRGPFLTQMTTILRREVRQRCGMRFGYEYAFNGNGEAPTIMQRLKQDGYTTIVCYCIPQLTELQVPAFQNAAAGLEYYPEWFFDFASRMDTAHWNREHGNPQMRTFGVSNLWRLGNFKETYAYAAYLEKQPNSQPNLRWNFEIYHVFLNLFSAIQAAGPRLTPETLKRGMFTFKYLNTDNWRVPTGSFGDWGPSPYTFVDTAMAFWYDPTGQPPGSNRREGCIRTSYEGKRFYAGQWPPGDEDIVLSTDPCSDDERKRLQ